MAYINQDQKKVINEALKKALQPYKAMGLKFSLSIRHHSTIVCKISSGPKALDPENKGYYDVNTYWIDSHYTGLQKEVFEKINECLHIGHHDNSDLQSDYFDVSHYCAIQVGEYNKPFVGV